jgi:hypothetical protein
LDNQDHQQKRKCNADNNVSEIFVRRWDAPTHALLAPGPIRDTSGHGRRYEKCMLNLDEAVRWDTMPLRDAQVDA